MFSCITSSRDIFPLFLEFKRKGGGGWCFVFRQSFDIDNIWVYYFLATRYCNVKSEIWINLYDNFNTEPYTWRESGQSAIYTNWAPGSPSDFHEKCTTFSTSSEGIWNDVVCGLLAPVVCERNL